MARILSMALVALLAAACVQVGPAPSGSPAAPSGSSVVPVLATTGAPAISAPPTAAPPTIAPGTSEPTRTRRPRPQRTDRPTRPPTQPSEQPSEQPSAQPPTAPPTEPPLADLIIEDLTAPQSPWPAGNPISIGFTIRNVGNAPSGAFAYSYDLRAGGGGGGGSTTVDGLLPGQSFVGYEDLGDADYANYVVTVSVVADSRDEVAESDESDNEASAQVHVICADAVLCP